MSEAEPIPPTSSVTALRIPMIKKGEYDLWSMKMRQYIAIHCSYTWDINHNGDQATMFLYPRQDHVFAPKTCLMHKHKMNNEKALNILLSAIPDRHLLSFHDAEDAKTLWSAIKARFGGNEAQKKMLKRNLQYFETNVLLVPGQISQKDILQAALQARCKLLLICFLLRLIYVLLCSTSIYATTHDDEDLLQIDEDAMEEIDIRWQVAMITARIRKFMRKIGRPIDLKPKNGITFDKSKIECFNCQKIDWTKNFDAEPVTFAMMALTELEEDDWSMEIDAEPVHFGQDGLGDFDWSNKADDTPVSLALMATNSEMEYDLKMRDLKLEEKQKELDQVLKERDDFKDLGTKGFHSVPPPTGTIIPPRANVSFTGIDELAIRNKVLNQENTKSSQPEIDRNKVIIEDWVDSDDEETVLNSSEIQKKTVFNSENSETSFENRSPSSQNSVGQGSRKTGVGHKGGKLCFVCYSPNHLIKDCNLHERTFKQTQTHKPKGTQGSRDTRPVWNNINRVNHSNFSRNSRYPHQRRSFIPSAVLTREGLKSTAKPKLTRTVPSKSTAHVSYQGTARPKAPHAVLSQSTGRPHYPIHRDCFLNIK
ncbi:hypothetical protein Tco_0040389 [Tanacetum coccineum]